MKSLFEYYDYREFLKDHYDESKRTKRYFSYRYIGSKTGLDPSFYVKVLNKQWHISEKSIPAITGFLKMNKKETDYFTLLVHFNKSDKQDEIKLYFEKLISLRAPIANTLDADKYQFFNKWYYIALRELLNFFPLQNDVKKLAAELNPPITVPETKKALVLLEKLSLIKKGKNGKYKLSDQFISTRDAWHNVAVRNFQKELFQLGQESIDRVPSEFRDLSTLTVSTSWSCFEAMRERLKEVRQELMEMASQDEDPEAVFHMNFQMFPLTQPPAGK